ncbi:class I SAM-dependent methyltransferase [Candidatus Falkowbacteria bacterium]|nr:class I SAM-dependent methyltransferase [Candidatus Falkowbacteria bacterium]
MNNLCPLCRGKAKLYLDYHKIGEGGSRANTSLSPKGDYKLLKCLACGLVYTDPIPDENFLNDFYQSYDSIGQKENYYKSIIHYQQTKGGRDLERFFLELAKKYKLNKESEILDLGSGSGVFLDILKRNNFRALGVEISGAAVDFAREKFAVNCVVADVLKVNFEPGRFGAVFMWDLLEHLPRQQALIKKIGGWLAHGGYVVIETPNNNALINGFILFLMDLGIVWPAAWMFGYHHLFLHSKKSLVKLLADNGFRILEIHQKNTAAKRIFPLKGKFFLPRIFLELLNGLAIIFNKKNKLIIIAKYGADG